MILNIFIDSTNCMFLENKANQGGVFASNTGQSVNHYSNNTYINNHAINYG